jgi:DNA-directed RNA polymerase specialized sigma subunit
VETVDRKNEKEILKQYLGRYYNSRRKKIQMEYRLQSILEEMNAPIRGTRYSPVNRRAGSEGTGAASFVYRMDEIETRIGNQKKVIEKDLLKVMDIMDFLKEDSLERMILELRFIDCKTWKTIEKEMHLSRRACFNYQDKALEALLGFKKVRCVLEEYRK